MGAHLPFIGTLEEFGSAEHVGRRPNSNEVLRSWLDLGRETVSYRRFFQRFLDFIGSQRPPLRSDQLSKTARMRLSGQTSLIMQDRYAGQYIVDFRSKGYSIQ